MQCDMQSSKRQASIHADIQGGHYSNAALLLRRGVQCAVPTENAVTGQPHMDSLIACMVRAPVRTQPGHPMSLPATV